MPDESPQKANRVVDEFARQLALLVADDGASLVRTIEAHSDRGFRIIQGEKSVRFFAKLSQTETGFWGLGIERARQMLDGKEPLVLLTSDEEGYFIPAVRLEQLIPSFSQDEAGHDYKISESKVRKTWRFRSLEELWELLRAKLS
jgi:hypothetical protein